MKPAYILFFLVLLCPFLLQAQSNYKPGFVVTLEGDTVRGFIDFKEWTNTPASIALRANISGKEEKVYTATDTRYFEITGMEAYQRYEGPITMNPVAIDRISFETKTLLKPVVVFLKINYKGDLIDLLSYTDQEKTRFFFQEKHSSQPQELYYNRYYTTSNSSQIITQKSYVGQLQFLVKKYDISNAVLNREVEAAAYTEHGMEKVFRMFNEIRVSKPSSKDYNSNSSRYYAGIALNASTVRITGIRGLHVPESNPVSLMPRLNLGADIFLNRHIQKLYLRIEGAVTAAKYHPENEVENERENYRFSYKIAQQSISISPQVIYSLYNKDNFKFHIGIIGQMSLSHYSENVFRQDYTYTYQHVSSPPLYSSEEHPGYMRTRTFWFTPGLRAGAVLNKRYEIYALYTPYATITSYQSNYEIAVRSLFLGVNYLFGKD